VEDAATLASYSGRLAASYLSKQIQQQIESVADRIDRLDRDIRRRGSRWLGLNGMFEGLRRVQASDIPGLRSQASRNPFLDLRTRFLNVAWTLDSHVQRSQLQAVRGVRSGHFRGGSTGSEFLAQVIQQDQTREEARSQGTFEDAGGIRRQDGVRRSTSTARPSVSGSPLGFGEVPGPRASMSGENRMSPTIDFGVESRSGSSMSIRQSIDSTLVQIRASILQDLSRRGSAHSRQASSTSTRSEDTLTGIGRNFLGPTAESSGSSRESQQSAAATMARNLRNQPPQNLSNRRGAGRGAGV
jgi:hypothetical protein